MPGVGFIRPAGGGGSASNPNRTPWVSSPVNANDDTLGNIYNFSVARVAATVASNTYTGMDFMNNIIQRKQGLQNYFGYVTPANAGSITGFTGILTLNATSFQIRVNGSFIMNLCNPSIEVEKVMKVERLVDGRFKFYVGNTLIYTSTYTDTNSIVPTAVASLGATYMCEAHLIT